MAIVITTPIVSAEQFAADNGMTKTAVNAQMDSGILPVYQVKKRGSRYINLVALAERCKELAEDFPWK